MEYKPKKENPSYRFGVGQENGLNEGGSWLGRNKATNHKQWISPVCTAEGSERSVHSTKAAG